MDRAKEHIDSFHKVWDQSLKDHPYKYTCGIHAEGLEHVYKLDRPPQVDPTLALIVGDALHNYRAGLDHLAYALVRLNNGCPTTSTSYPIELGSAVSGGVSTKAQGVIDEVYGLDDGRMVSHLRGLAALDNIDKHRHLHVVAAVPNNATLAVEYLGPGQSSNIDHTRSKLFPVSLDKHGKVVAKIVYLTPVGTPDPDFSVEPVLVFGKERMPRAVRGAPVPGLLWALWGHLRWEAIPKFEALFP